MKTKVLFSLLLFTLAIWSCQQDDGTDIQALVSGDDCPNCINFENLQVGQQSRYVAFTGKRDFEDQDYHYLSDTLVVQVAAQEGEDFILEEFLTSDPDSIRTYRIALIDNIINIQLNEYWIGSWLFQGGTNLNIALEPRNYQSAEMKGWEAIVSCETAPCYGYLAEYEQGRFAYKDVYVYHNYGPMAWDGNGFFAIYNAKYGIVRSVSVGSWVPVAGGWDLIIE